MKIKSILSVPFHPFVLAIYFPLTLFYLNIEEAVFALHVGIRGDRLFAGTSFLQGMVEGGSACQPDHIPLLHLRTYTKPGAERNPRFVRVWPAPHHDPAMDRPVRTGIAVDQKDKG
jgi:hypothetical protein